MCFRQVNYSCFIAFSVQPGARCFISVTAVMAAAGQEKKTMNVIELTILKPNAFGLLLRISRTYCVA